MLKILSFSENKKTLLLEEFRLKGLDFTPDLIEYRDPSYDRAIRMPLLFFYFLKIYS
jgi:hypothetical protein